MTPLPAFSARVRAGFAGGAAAYDHQATLQRAIAWRLAHACRSLPLPPGPAADLGAGTGLLARALADQPQATSPASGHETPAARARQLLQLDLCTELLARNPLAIPTTSRVWDLDQGLPRELDGAAFLSSSFALQWLSRPATQLEHWCQALAPGGWLGLAVPTAASFPQWHRAAERAGVPFTGLALPEAADLEAVARRRLEMWRLQRLRFTRPGGDGRQFLHQLRALGAGTSAHPPLSAPQLRRLLQHWPAGEGITWEVLLLIGQRPA
ncbi:methyltransferase domain-containing protein [Cyanobium sp. ATX 6A2]|uniref:methyltransferase domain-containing protein n=1 Tax=Cyanobium sp. ATX 6A2 TaxID=2823700 RepID=UPI0020CD3903|nr:methyltransferase domain-containing protein [Cyanobium sp. ATX 6A2]